MKHVAPYTTVRKMSSLSSQSHRLLRLVKKSEDDLYSKSSGGDRTRATYVTVATETVAAVVAVFFSPLRRLSASATNLVFGSSRKFG